MIHRGTTRESKTKKVWLVQESTREAKYRRHKNKKRIWRRCVLRLSQQMRGATVLITG